jgi:phage gpG-like protein
MIKNKSNFNGKILSSLEAKLREMGKIRTYVGVPASKNQRNDETGISNAEIAAAHEFGVPGHIPERSFLRSTVEENKEKAAAFLAKNILETLLTDGDKTTPFALLGEKMAGEVKRKIQTGIDPALNPKTIERKGSSKPLIDTGQLLQSITYEVRENDDG